MSLLPIKRVWIVGAGGLLGSVLRERCVRCRAVYEAEHGGLGMVRRSFERGVAARCTLAFDPLCRGGGIASCVQEPGAIARAVELAGEPELVYFCAATRGGDAAAYRRAYLEPVQAVAAAAPSARLVFCSSAAVYEGQGDAAEDAPTPGSTEKLRILLEAEQAVREAGGVVARLAPLYGGGRCELLRRHLAGEPQLPGAPERTLNYLHVEAAADALFLLGYAPQLRHSVYNVCDETFTKAQAYAMLEALTGIPASRESASAGRRGISDHRVVAERIREVYAPQPHFASYVQSCLRGDGAGDL